MGAYKFEIRIHEELLPPKTRAGLPTATDISGTSDSTTEPAPIVEKGPIVTEPNITTFAPTSTPSWIVGHPPFGILVPNVVPCLKVTPLPTTHASFTTKPKPCEMARISPTRVFTGSSIPSIHSEIN
ncbi:hypothetical protein GCM10009773_12370 [Williamsia serinedens]